MKAAILGAGVMGRNIARVLAGSGFEVALYSRSEATLADARSVLDAGGLREVTYDTSIERSVAGAELVLESVPESLELKQAVVAQAERAAPGAAVIASNTSSLPLERIAHRLDRPQRFLGWHWFNPAHLMPLVEVIATPATGPEIVQWSMTVLAAAGKRPTPAPAIDGFLVNRLQYALIREALALVDAGLATPEQIDAALTGCLGPRWAVIGPMRSTDLAGIPTALAVAAQLYPTLSDAKAPQAALTRLQAEGRLGAGAGNGFYVYPDAGAAGAERDRLLSVVLEALDEAR
jgi:3-hydroxybutyryl-CoA dehydrogenase